MHARMETIRPCFFVSIMFVSSCLPNDNCSINICTIQKIHPINTHVHTYKHTHTRTADIPMLILEGSVFQRQPTAELLVGSSVRLRVTWQLLRTNCIDSVSVEFFERGNSNAIVRRTSLTSTVTEVVQSGLPCNRYITATVRVSASGFRTSFATTENYIGGMTNVSDFINYFTITSP